MLEQRSVHRPSFNWWVMLKGSWPSSRPPPNRLRVAFFCLRSMLFQPIPQGIIHPGLPPRATRPVSEYLASLRQGDEWALASILFGRVVALLYMSKIAPELVEHLDTPGAEFKVKRWAQTAPADLLDPQALGNVSAGIVTADGFEERWRLAE